MGLGKSPREWAVRHRLQLSPAFSSMHPSRSLALTLLLPAFQPRTARDNHCYFRSVGFAGHKYMSSTLLARTARVGAKAARMIRVLRLDGASDPLTELLLAHARRLEQCMCLGPSFSISFSGPVRTVHGNATAVRLDPRIPQTSPQMISERVLQWLRGSEKTPAAHCHSCPAPGSEQPRPSLQSFSTSPSLQVRILKLYKAYYEASDRACNLTPWAPKRQSACASWPGPSMVIRGR